MALVPPGRTVTGVMRSYPSAWLLLALPFISGMTIASTPRLRNLTARHNGVTSLIGVIGLGCLTAGLLGAWSLPYALVLTIAGGSVSGFSMFGRWPRISRDDGDDWRRGREPPEEPPPPRTPDGSINWDAFDRLRAQWEHGPVGDRTTGPFRASSFNS
jgi:hypothetical protein